MLNKTPFLAQAAVQILHHFDVFHVEVKVVESFRKLVEDMTKQAPIARV